MSTKPVSVAIVGCGRISDLHALGYRGRDDAKITAVCDTDKDLANSKAKAWGAEKVYYDYAGLLEDRDIDLVELLVPHYLHAEMAIAACRAGKHVSVQKPMATCVADADRMIEAAQKAGVLLRIYETFVFYPPAVLAKKMIDAGEIGEPQMLRMHINTGKTECGWESRSKPGSGGLMKRNAVEALWFLITVIIFFPWLTTSWARWKRSMHGLISQLSCPMFTSMRLR